MENKCLIASCYNNVYLINDRYKINYCKIHRDQPHHICQTWKCKIIIINL